MQDLKKSKSHGIGDRHFSALCQFLRGVREQRWQQDHAEFIAAYNQTVEKEGLPLEQWRAF